MRKEERRGKEERMNKKYLVLIGIGLMLAVLLIANAGALGITPGRTTLDFSPNQRHAITATVINSEHKDIDLVIVVQGELKDYVRLYQDSLSMSADESAKDISFDLNLPSELKPGLNSVEVVVLEVPESSPMSEAYVRAVLAVVTQVHVYVPYPGKYAEAELHITDADAGDDVTFIIPVENKGLLDLSDVRANIDIYNKMGEKITSFNTESIAIKSDERKELVARWKADAEVGSYRAVVSVLYDGEGSISLEGQFNIGKSVLELQEVRVSDFSLGDIAKFEMLVENKWSEIISGAYAKTNVYNEDGQVMADFKSAAYDIPSLTKKTLVSYWDTKGVKVGTYDASIYINYGDKSNQVDVQFKVSDDEIEIIGLGYVISKKGPKKGFSFSGNLVAILIVVVVVLVIVNLLWFLRFRKKLSGKSGNKQ